METAGKISGQGRVKLAWRVWLPRKTRAAVLLIHGFGEHCGRYGNVVDTLLPAGFSVWGIDHRGHGKSQGLQGHVDSFMDYVEDVHTYYEEVVSPVTGSLPIFVLGHSMGSIIAMNYACRYQDELAGCVLSGTGSTSPISGGKAVRTLTAILSRLVPRARINFPLSPDFISRDPKVVDAYKEDPLVHAQISFRLARSMSTALATGVEGIGKVDLPILIQCGSEDESFAGQQQLFDGLQAQDKTLKIYPGLKHEVYNELESDRKVVLSDLVTWLQQRIESRQKVM